MALVVRITQGAPRVTIRGKALLPVLDPIQDIADAAQASADAAALSATAAQTAETNAETAETNAETAEAAAEAAQAAAEAAAASISEATFVHDQTDVALASGDHVLIADASDSNATKKGELNDLRTALAASDSAAGMIEFAVQAEMETGTDATLAVTPGRQHFHPSAAKCWGFATVSAGTPTLQTSYNVTSITDTNTGRLTVTIATDFSSANYPVVVEAAAAATDAEFTYVLHSSKAAGSFEIRHANNAGTLADPLSWSWVAFGDHA